jgi:cytochrome c oxidase subunit 2
MIQLLTLLAQSDQSDSLIPPPPRDVHEGSYWFPEVASTFAKDVDSLFMLIFWVSLIFFVGIVGTMVYFVIKYRARPGHTVEKSPSHNTALEIAWSVLPGFLLIWFFVDGARGYFNQRVIPGDSEQIQVIARQFNWEFHYPNGDVTTDLHLVQNRPVEFVMESRDVLHSFFVPAFRQKQDLVPGRYTYTWVKPTKAGVYRLYCTEYCGDGHSLMRTNVTVHATDDERDAATYYDWEGNSPIDNGKRLFNMKCAGCHNPTEEKKVGPGFGNIWGRSEQMDDGSQIVVDDNYFRESILNPNARIVAGYTRPSQMPSFQGQLNDDQILWLRAYARSLSGLVDEEPAGQGGEEAAADDADAAAADQPPGDEEGAGEEKQTP